MEGWAIFYIFPIISPIQLHSGVIHLHASGVEGQVSVLVLQHGHHLAGVQAPPVQQEGGMCGGLVHAPTNLFGFGVIGEVPGFGLPQEMDHFGIATVSVRNIKGLICFSVFFLKTNAHRERNSWKVLVQRRPFVSFFFYCHLW